MSERYSRLFSLPDNLYLEGSPVLIAAGALLKDNTTGKVLAQLKLKNICKENIKAVKVQITPLDIAGRELSNPIEHQYLDFNAVRDEEFGQKQPILLPNDSARSFSVAITEVIFADNSIWTSSRESWSALPSPEKISEQIQDIELLKQYHIEYGSESKFVASEILDLWYCTCGAVNQKEESICHRCHKKLEDFKSINLELLTEKRDDRLRKEQQAREEAAKKAAEEKALAEAKAAEEKALKEANAKSKRKKRKKIALISILIVLVCAILAVVFAPNIKYYLAVSDRNAGRYLEAIDKFTELGDFKDAADQVTETNYMRAVSLFSEKEYATAIRLFKSLGNYKDSAQQVESVNQAAYQDGLAAIKKKDYTTAEQLFIISNGYQDSNEYQVYSHIKALDFNDGASRNLNSLYVKIQSMTDNNLRNELLDISQFKTVQMLEGRWYIYYSSSSGNNSVIFIEKTLAKYRSS